MGGAMTIAIVILLVSIVFTILLVRESLHVTRRRNALLSQLDTQHATRKTVAKAVLILYIVTTVVWTLVIIGAFLALNQ